MLPAFRGVSSSDDSIAARIAAARSQLAYQSSALGQLSAAAAASGRPNPADSLFASHALNQFGGGSLSLSGSSDLLRGLGTSPSLPNPAAAAAGAAGLSGVNQLQQVNADRALLQAQLQLQEQQALWPSTLRGSGTGTGGGLFQRGGLQEDPRSPGGPEGRR